MLTSVADIELPDLRGVWIVAKVTSNDDSGETNGPKLQRIRVTVPGLYEPESPWCWPKQLSLFAGGQGEGHGSFGVPAVDSYVIIELEQGDPHHPVYVASLLIHGNQITEAGVNYPNRYGFKDKLGNYFYIDQTEGQGTVKFRHFSGTQIDIDNSGAMTITAPAGLTIVGDVNVTGAVTASDEGTFNGIAVSTHTHDQSGGGTTDPPNP